MKTTAHERLDEEPSAPAKDVPDVPTDADVIEEFVFDDLQEDAA